MVKGLKGIHTALVKRNVEIHTPSTVDLISSVAAVGLSIAYKQRMQRTVATTVLCGPR